MSIFVFDMELGLSKCAHAFCMSSSVVYIPVLYIYIYYLFIYLNTKFSLIRHDNKKKKTFEKG